MQKVSLTTEDGVELAGLWWDVGGPRSALLLHMMPATKESWVPLAEKLAENGLNVLAIDFRGHGESGGGGYRNFSAEEHQKYVLDAESALGFLRGKQPTGEIVLAGASIGANVALKLMNPASGMGISRGVALSPGLDYYGLRAGEFVSKLNSSQSVLFVGSRDDMRGGGQDCGAMAEELFSFCTCKKDKIVYETGGHGTDMFSSHPELVHGVNNFLAH